MTASAQTFGEISTSGYDTQKYIEKNLDKQINKGQNKNQISSFRKTINGDTLTYIIQHITDPFRVTMVFNIKDTVLNEKYCGFQEYSFDCTPCSQKHLQEFIKMYRFRQKSENVYLSQYLIRTEMVVTYKSNNKDCLIVTFRTIELPKKQYKELYKSLKKTTA
jgi:hypothetical protein